MAKRHETAGKPQFFTASQIAVVPKGCRHHGHGQAILMYSKPQWSRPTRAQDIAGKLRTFDRNPQQSQPPRARDIEGELHHWWQSCKRASMGQQRNHAKNGLKRNFFLGKWQHLRQPWYKVDAIGSFLKQKSNVREVKFACFHGAPLKRRAELADKLSV